MAAMVIDIQPSEMEQIQERAEKLGVDAETIVMMAISNFLPKSDEEIQKIMRDSIRRHENALKRLA